MPEGKKSVSLDEYFGIYANHPDATPSKWSVAELFLDKVNDLLECMHDCGLTLHINPQTNSLISGTTNGGFRPLDCKVGAPNSSHKLGRGVDIADVGNHLDAWINDEILEKFGLYREHPDDTENWLHLSDKPPKSGRRTFKP